MDDHGPDQQAERHGGRDSAQEVPRRPARLLEGCPDRFQIGEAVRIDGLDRVVERQVHCDRDQERNGIEAPGAREPWEGAARPRSPLATRTAGGMITMAKAVPRRSLMTTCSPCRSASVPQSQSRLRPLRASRTRTRLRGSALRGSARPLTGVRSRGISVGVPSSFMPAPLPGPAGPSALFRVRSRDSHSTRARPLLPPQRREPLSLYANRRPCARGLRESRDPACGHAAAPGRLRLSPSRRSSL